MNAIILNLVVIAVIVAGWTGAVWAFYTRLDDSPAPRAARGREETQIPDADPRAVTRRDVGRAA